MEVPFRLVRREPTTNPADAFLLPAADASSIAGACARFNELPAVFAVRGGFLLVPPAPDARAVPGAIRLRRSAGDLFVPVDANLLPALLPDEATSLTRTRGLIVTAGGTVLAFDVTAPLPITDWLKPRAVRRSEWRSFPERPDRPNTLMVIERPVPPMEAVIEILGAGAPDADPLPGAGQGAKSGTGKAVPEAARPPASGSMLGRAVAGAGLAVGGVLAWLGKQLGAGGLARAGADLARRAIERVPRLSEKLFGEQEAALREVLRQLQSGDVEKGLQHAPIAVADPDQPARVGTDAKLTRRDPRYSLRDLVGTGRGGAGAVWLGGADVWDELAREYRRLAAEASARGDHRRAAYLYGVLLRDLRGAANALLAGGLFRDAAVLFRDRLNDPRAAAEAFERAGIHDEALRLYDRMGLHENAAELLRRLGHEERAVARFLMAANRLKADGRFLAAGDLMRAKAHRRDPATEFYRLGWLASTTAESVTCGTRLLDEYSAADNRPGYEILVNEAGSALLDRPRDAGRFFNHALRTSMDFLPEDARADLADRVRLMFAEHLRTHALLGEAGTLADDLFRSEQVWAPPVNRDAMFAVRGRSAPPAPPESPKPDHPREPDRRLIAGPVTAVVAVRGTFDVVVAGAGEIVCWRVSDGRVQSVATKSERVTALSASARGDVIYAVTNGADGKWRLRCFAADRGGTFRPTTQYTLPTGESTDPTIYLQSAATFRAGEHRIAVSTPVENLAFAGPYLQSDPTALFIGDELPVRLLARFADGGVWCWAGTGIWYRPDSDAPVCLWKAPAIPGAEIDWLTPAPSVLEVVTVDRGGYLCWAEFDARDENQPRTRSSFAEHPTGVTVACLVAPSTIAAATNTNEIHWLRVAGNQLIVSASVTLSVPSCVVSLTARPDSNEVIVIFADGGGCRVRRP
ncbi:hypothetical protein J8F10_05220 [Gemmata sp. G18]|uniref:MoxR-vWA-beta-propeller ternary system domain-containing protein n=1 Tax=Gemmata palustris TaxID=2822762 RepID=A0ABS5BLX8_9BACT|nr:hypothetical protein [Gemmata palustris]MBP3954683.1 hypothetical protein [Gemmata palustris]